MAVTMSSMVHAVGNIIDLTVPSEWYTEQYSTHSSLPYKSVLELKMPFENYRKGLIIAVK